MVRWPLWRELSVATRQMSNGQPASPSRKGESTGKAKVSMALSMSGSVIAIASRGLVGPA